jgi:BMFP domain-containing protein YqiC
MPLGPKQFDDLTRRIVDSLPPGLADIQEDIRQNLRATVSGAMERMDLVTREEFDVQRLVLERTREKLERLESRVAALETDDSADLG